MNGSALWLTTNDGDRWRTITPPQLRGQDVTARVGDVDFLDPTHGWVTAELNGTRSVNGNLRYGGISITANGGKSWHLVTLPGCYQCANTHVSFLDRDHGYALAFGESAQARLIARLYKTSDGGRQWTLVRPMAFHGQVLFTNERDGWAISAPCCANPIKGETLYRTTNGGHTWRRAYPPVPTAYVNERQLGISLQFFNSHDGVIATLALDRLTKRMRVLVDTTKDGGTSWSVRAAPLASEQPDNQDIPSASFSAASMTDWMLFSRTAPILFRTADGGHSWRAVSISPHPRPAFVWEPDFITSLRGWAVFPDGNAGNALVRTTDGGRTWTPLIPPMPKAPPVPIRPPVCSSPCRRP